MMKRKQEGNTPKAAGARSQKSQTRTGVRMRCTVERLVECCRLSNGIMLSVAQQLGVDWHTADKYVKNCPEAQEAFRCARETVKDVGEGNLFRIVNNPKHPRHFDAIAFLLKNLAKDRGYTERIEQEHSGIKAPPSLNIVIEK